MQEIDSVGLDLAKHAFQIHAVAADGTVVLKRQLRRAEVLSFFAKLRQVDVLLSQGTPFPTPSARPASRR